MEMMEREVSADTLQAMEGSPLIMSHLQDACWWGEPKHFFCFQKILAEAESHEDL